MMAEAGDDAVATDPQHVKRANRRRWRGVTIAFLAAIAVATGIAAYVFRPLPIDRPPPLAQLGGNAEQGAYLARIGNCAACHTPPGGAPYAGGVRFVTPFGTLYSTNISPDRQSGIGDWSFEQFHAALKHGLRPDGSHLYPAFPYGSFARMTDRDIASLYLYFRSVPPVAQANVANAMDFPFGNRFLMHFWNRLYHQPDSLSRDRTRSPQWNRGRYLVEAVAHCGACHSPRNMLGAIDESRALSGGTYVDRVALGFYRPWSAVDLTPGTHGLRQWRERDIVDYLLNGQNGRAVIHGPMAEVFESTRHLTPADAASIATYLHGIEPSPTRFDWSMLRSGVDRGEIVYTVHCGTCHLPNGQGDRILGVSLAHNPIVQARDPASLINVVLYGPDLPPPPFTSTRTRMKPFGKRLSDEDVAALATYLRSSFGNNAPQVSADEVAAQR